MEQISQALRKCTELRERLPYLREDKTRDGQIKYYSTMLEVLERQHNMYSRLLLIGSEETRETMAEMQKVAESHMNKPEDQSMNNFFKRLRREVTWELVRLSPGWKFDPNSLS